MNWLLAAISSVAVAFFGLQQSQPIIGLIGILFLVILAIAYVMNKEIVRSEGVFYMGALGYWLFQVPFYIGNTGAQFSFLSAPTNSYLSLLSQTPVHIQDLVNKFWAPRAENLLVLAEIVFIYKMLRASDIPFVSAMVPALVLSVAIGVGTFAFIHGVRDFSFFIRAAVVMTVIAGTTAAVDLDLLSTGWVPVSIGAGIGLHQGINVGQGGGPFPYYQTLISAPEPYHLLGWIVTLWDVITLAAALYAVYRLAVVPGATMVSDLLG